MNYPAEKKEWAVATAKEHRQQDMLLKGDWWDGDKGCSLGCFIQSDEDVIKKAAALFDLPLWLMKLHEQIYEGVSDPEYHVKFFEAIPEGITDEHLKSAYHKTSSDRMDRLLQLDLDSEVKAAISEVKNLHDQRCTDTDKWSKARTAAYAAPATTDAASASAAYASAAAAYAVTRTAVNVATVSASAAAGAAAYATTAAAYAADAAARAKVWQMEQDSLLNALNICNPL